MRLISSLVVALVWFVLGGSAWPSVGLLIEHGDGAQLSRCVPAESTPMSLTRLLDVAGIVYAATAGNDQLAVVDGEGGALGRLWYVSAKSPAGESLPTATGLASLLFSAGDVAYLQYAETPRAPVPARHAELCHTRNRAALVIVHSSGETVERCVTFPGQSTTAGRLLDLSGIPTEIASFFFGRAICAINGEGCPTDDCFGCDAQGRYWGLFLRGADGRGIASDYGSDQTTVLPGDVVVFYYAEFGKQPPMRSFAQVCAGDARLEANLHLLEGGTFAVVATAVSPYALGDSTAPARLRLILPEGLSLFSAGDGAAVESVGQREMSAVWVVGQASPEAGLAYRLRVQLESLSGEEHRILGWHAPRSKDADLNHDGRVDASDLLILRREWEP